MLRCRAARQENGAGLVSLEVGGQSSNAKAEAKVTQPKTETETDSGSGSGTDRESRLSNMQKQISIMPQGWRKDWKIAIDFLMKKEKGLLFPSWSLRGMHGWGGGGHRSTLTCTAALHSTISSTIIHSIKLRSVIDDLYAHSTERTVRSLPGSAGIHLLPPEPEF